MRCDDCLDDLPPRCWAVLDDAEPDDDKHVCTECAGWYPTAIEVDTPS